VRTVTIEYLDALADAIASMISSRLLARVIVRQRALKRVMQAVPAVRELVALERVRTLAHEIPGARVIVDLPATGHAVDWLRVVAAAERFLRTGPAAKMCRAILDEVLSPDRSAIVVVSTAEPVVASETGELCERLVSELDRTPDLVIVNRVPRRPSASELEAAARRAKTDPRYAPLSDALSADAATQSETALALASLRGIAGARVAEVPDLFADPEPRSFAALVGVTT
jgi:anion-transporting  ArsA/GET3 family ATPase